MFITRNLAYAVTNPRRLPAVRRAMRLHKKLNPTCEFCGVKTFLVHCHHKIPCKTSPELAGDPGNLMTLCPECHFTVGHMSSWFTYNKSVVETCKAADRVKS